MSRLRLRLGNRGFTLPQIFAVSLGVIILTAVIWHRVAPTRDPGSDRALRERPAVATQTMVANNG